jgi:hypothetical protein
VIQESQLLSVWPSVPPGLHAPESLVAVLAIVSSVMYSNEVELGMYGCRGVLSSPFPCMTELQPDSRYSGSLQQAKAVASRAALTVSNLLTMPALLLHFYY